MTLFGFLYTQTINSIILQFFIVINLLDGPHYLNIYLVIYNHSLLYNLLSITPLSFHHILAKSCLCLLSSSF
jgi:hypothetical protein